MNSLCPAQTTRGVIAGLALILGAAAATAQTSLADQPIFTSIAVPGNLALALSVEFPTAVSVAHKNAAYSSASTYLGYFDPAKCYVYNPDAVETQRYFAPSSLTTNHTCVNKWSGNFLNWATMQTIDPFRWALTGGYRSTDTTSLTLIEKAWASGQGGTGNFPNRSLPNTATIASATPLNFSSLNMRIQGLGNKLWFSSGTVGTAPTNFTTPAAAVAGTTYEVSVRLRVCDASVGLESNCVQYSANNYKPIGLIQKYADKIRYSAFGYLNDNSLSRDGGVLRAKQKFVGPSQPVPGGLPTSNAAAEWDSATGIMLSNPNPTDAAVTATNFGVTISNSGVMNYLNKFGELTQSATSYKTYDPVGELYYTALRYYKNLGNVPEYTNMAGANTATKTTWADGFPVITNWDDPVQYSCQKNFILGIGDVNTHADRNLPGATGGSEPAKPGAVSADRTVDALAATNTVGVMQGLGNSLGATQPYGGCCNNNGALMAGLAYDANTVDIRPDITGKQTVQTYWLDVLETGYKNNNQFYLAAKYGGFAVPEGFVPYPRTTDITQSWWYTTTDMVGSQPRPDNYFTAGQPDLMVAGLTKAFSSIASKLNGYSTGFATATPQFSSTGVGSYSARYDASNWSGDVIGNTVSFNLTTNVVSSAQAWQFSTKLANQAAGTGWQSGRFIATYNTSSKAGVPFRIANLSSSQVSNLDTAYRSGSDSTDYLNYLRGDSSQEQGSAVAGSSQAYRSRSNLVGDIVDAQLLVVGPPAYGFSEPANPGYAQFKSDYATRKTVVYAGTNRGMLHAIDGALTGSTAGTELFAYVPGATYDGPTGTPANNGLQSLGNPDFTHYNFVDATPIAADVDLGKTVGGSGTNWRTLLIGGLGKGGKSFFALDVTAPNTWTSESAVASKVLWEFTDSDMGYSLGQAAMAKTKKYGWVAIFGSGYNNADGRGYFFIVNPRTGALLEKISTGVGSPSNPAGLARVKPFFIDVTDGTADSVYAGDLLGNVWRLDLSGTPAAYPAPVRLAQLIDAASQPLPVTSRPTIAVHPKTNRRYVTVGTGRLLSGTDLGSAQGQRFYAILDGTGSAFSQTQPNRSNYPVQTSDLKPLTDLSQPINLDLTRYAGWYVDLGTLSAGPGWRVIVDPISFYGSVSFAAMAPSSSDACNPAGNSRVYSIDLGSGQSLLPSNTPYLDVPGVVISLTGASVSGQYRIVPATTDGPKPPIVRNPPAREDARRLNWREIPLTN